MLFGENMVSKKLKIVCSVNLSRLEFVSLPIADKLQPNFYKLLHVEQRITKLNWKSTMYSVTKCPWILIFILLRLIFSRFLIVFIYITNIGYWQVLFITQEQLGKSCSATSTFKYQGCSCTCFTAQFKHLYRTPGIML